MYCKNNSNTKKNNRCSNEESNYANFKTINNQNSRKNGCGCSKDPSERYFRCDHNFNTNSEKRVNNHFVRNNHHMNTNNYYVKDYYYVNDFYYNKDIYHYDREVVQKSYDCGTQTIIDPTEIYSKPTPYHTECMEQHYDECTEDEFCNSFKCNSHCESDKECDCCCHCNCK